MDTLTKTIANIDEMESEARLFIEALPAEMGHATLVTLAGELGAGKTTFTQFVAKALGIDDVVNSPTFVIEKIYSIEPSGLNESEVGEGNPRNRFSRLVHIDAYRLQSAGDLNSLGFGEIMSHPGTLIFIEWPEHVLGIAEEASVKILLEYLPDGSGARQITYA
jgi:tRNA threonylcarbamoyladenosine biosynthesis protein TsaE